jgi:cathepsin L
MHTLWASASSSRVGRLPCWLESYSFDDYVHEFNKNYQPLEEPLRKQIFNMKLKEIRAHNSDHTKSWKMTVNQFTDRTDDEFRNVLGMRKGMLYGKKNSNEYASSTLKLDLSAIPTNVDWRKRGVVTEVKDQGACGSCWSFGTTETTESYYAITTGKLVVLSEQQILDCTPNPQQCGGTGGCGGGTAELAWARIIQLGGLASEVSYPYVSGDGSAHTCYFSKVTPVANVTGYVNLPSNDPAPILNHLANNGPLAISVDAGTWSSYGGGVYDGCDQSSPDLDHEVMLVGYGTDSVNGDYWLVRNSWGPGWGEDGYIRLSRKATPQCGTDTTPADGDGCTGGPPTVKVCGTCGILYDAVYPVMGKN